MDIVKNIILKDNEKICMNCLFVKDKSDFINNEGNCKKCRDKIERESQEYKSIIIIKNGCRYKQSKDRLRRLCNLEKCNYVSSATGFCKKHNIKDNEKICMNCLFVKDKSDFINEGNCKKCRDKIERESPEYKSIIIIKNGHRYKIFPNSGSRKLCKIETCDSVSSGNFCRKHKPQNIKDNQKQCHRCLNIKSLTEFKDNIDHKIEYEHCINCRKYKREQSLIRHQSRRKFLLQIKIDMGGKCIDCNTEDLEILEFDHITDDKITELCRIYNYQGILDEAKKTELRCSNCHFIKTKATVIKPQIDETKNKKSTIFGRKYRENARNYVNNIKINSNGCSECGFFDINNLQVLHFDHVDINTKEHNIAHLVGSGRSINLIQTEIDKCRILCANCHRKHTLRQFNFPILDIIVHHTH